MEDTGEKRTFDSGATRGTAKGKIDLEGAFSVLSFERYGEYMLEHTTDSTGQDRASDNWQAGFPLSSYVKSLLRHVLALWRVNRGFGDLGAKFLEDTLCAIIFNAQGYLHEHLKGKQLKVKNTLDLFGNDSKLLESKSVCKHCKVTTGAITTSYQVYSLKCCKTHCFNCSDHKAEFSRHSWRGGGEGQQSSKTKGRA